MPQITLYLTQTRSVCSYFLMFRFASWPFTLYDMFWLQDIFLVNTIKGIIVFIFGYFTPNFHLWLVFTNKIFYAMSINICCCAWYNVTIWLVRLIILQEYARNLRAIGIDAREIESYSALWQCVAPKDKQENIQFWCKGRCQYIKMFLIIPRYA
jgi:hypothetical protein